MLKYKESSLYRAGFIGVTLLILVITVGLRPESLLNWATTVRYHAVLADAGGLAVGNDVTKSGIKVGTVSGLSLERGKAIATLTVDASVPLKSETTAHVRTGSLLGERVVTLNSSGSSAMKPGDTIPMTRTSSPYSLTDAVSELTTNTAGTDTANLNRSLDTLSDTINQIAPQLGPTFDGLSRLSRSLNDRNETLRQLLAGTADVSGILAQRSDQVNTLILNANDLIGVLNERRQAIVDLLGSTSALAQQLTGLVRDNETELAPTLDKLNEVTGMLEKNRDNIAKALPGLAKFQVTQGETVASGLYYNAYVPNLAIGQIFQPFFDYAFGFRRGTDAGQPPDNAGPRAEFPFPYNGIPGGSR